MDNTAMTDQPTTRGDADLPTSATRWRSQVAVGALIILTIALCAYVPLVSSAGVKDSDSTKILWALTRGIQSGDGMEIETLVYGRSKNIGYYIPFFVLYPENFGLERIDRVMNWLNLVSVVLTVVCFYLIMSWVVGPWISLILAVLLIFRPVLWDLAGYGHPLGPSLALLMFGWLCLYLSRYRCNARGCVLLILSAALLTASALVRGEAILAFPAICLTPLLSCERGRTLGKQVFGAMAICVVAFFAYLMLNPWGQADSNNSSNPMVFVIDYIRGMHELTSVKVALVYWATAAGPFLSLLAVVGLGVALWRRGWSVLIVAAAWILPAAVFFIWSPERARHWMMTLPGLTMLAVYPFWRWRGRWAVLLVAVVLAADYGSAVAVQRAVASRYDWHFEQVTDPPVSVSVPLGGMVGYRATVDQLQAVMAEDAERVANVRDHDVFAGGGPSMAILGRALALRYPKATWSTRIIDRVKITEVETGSNRFAFVFQVGEELNQLLAKLSAANEYAGYRVYVMAADRVAGVPLQLCGDQHALVIETRRQPHRISHSADAPSGQAHDSD